jgi:hypothetical protein
MIELGLSEHFESPIQVLPFVLCSLGLVALALDRYRPGRRSRNLLRASMLLVALGGAFGVYEHLEHNLAFELEIHPSLTASALWLEALMGASPLLAPGVLAVIGVLVAASTYGEVQRTASES